MKRLFLLQLTTTPAGVTKQWRRQRPKTARLIPTRWRKQQQQQQECGKIFLQHQPHTENL